MRVLILGTQMTREQAGANRSLLAFARALARSSDATPTLFVHTLDRELLDPPMPVIQYTPPPAHRFLWRFPSAYLVRAHERELTMHPLPPADIAYTVHLHLALAFRNKRPNVPLITHTGAVISSREAVEENWNRPKWEARIEAWLLDRLERRSYREPKWTHIVSTRLVAEQREKHFCLPKNFFRICPRGLDVHGFLKNTVTADVRSQRGIARTAFVVVTVARLVRWKRIDMLLNAVARMSGDVHLLVVGDGPERNNLAEQAQGLGIASKVHFAGWTSPRDWLAAADVFALPSEIESFGVVYAEAMLSGLPCIGAKHNPPSVISSAQDVIPEGVAGFCVDSVEMLVERLQWLRENPSLRRKMGETARAWASREYSDERYLELFLQEARALLVASPSTAS